MAFFNRDGRAIGEACPLLLVAAGAEPSDEATVWRHGAAGACVGGAGGVELTQVGEKINAEERRRIRTGVPRDPFNKRSSQGFGLPGRAGMALQADGGLSNVEFFDENARAARLGVECPKLKAQNGNS